MSPPLGPVVVAEQGALAEAAAKVDFMDICVVLDDPPCSLFWLRARRWSGGGGLAWLKRPRGGCLKGLGLLRPHLRKANSAAWGEVGCYCY